MRALKAIVPMPWHNFTKVSGAWMLHPRDAHLLDPVLAIDAFELRDMPFAPHPHAGFSAVTVLFEDSETGVANYDSLGDQSTILPGGLHWTQAGRGMMHDEPPLREGVRVAGLQVFVNLATIHKEAAPCAFSVTADAVPVIEADGVRVRVVTGHYGGKSSPISAVADWHTPVTMLDTTLQPGSRWQAQIPQGQRAFFVLMRGAVRAAGEVAHARCAIVFADAGDHAVIENPGTGIAQGVLFIGTPLGEPIVAHGPFNGNTPADIMRYIRRYQAGGMGVLEADGRLIAKPDLSVG